MLNMWINVLIFHFQRIVFVHYSKVTCIWALSGAKHSKMYHYKSKMETPLARLRAHQVLWGQKSLLWLTFSQRRIYSFCNFCYLLSRHKHHNHSKQPQLKKTTKKIEFLNIWFRYYLEARLRKTADSKVAHFSKGKNVDFKKSARDFDKSERLTSMLLVITCFDFCV